MSSQQILDEIIRHGDSIVIPGSHCDPITGEPIKNLRVRCHAEYALKVRMPHYKKTIVSGGSARGVEAYRKSNPGATEAEQMLKYARNNGQDLSEYIAEPYALESLGNIIFSTKAILQNHLTTPVFISQPLHAYRLKKVASHWFRRSGIRPWVYAVEEDRSEE